MGRCLSAAFTSEVVMNRSTDLPILGDGTDAQSGRDTINGPWSTICVLHDFVEDVLGPQAHIPTMIGCGHADIGIDSRIAREPASGLREVVLVAIGQIG